MRFFFFCWRTSATHLRVTVLHEIFPETSSTGGFIPLFDQNTTLEVTPPPPTPLTQLPNNFPQWVHWRYSKYFPHWLTDWFVASWTRLASRGKKHRSSNGNNKKLINILIYVSQFRRFYYINKNVPGPSAGGWRRLGVISGFAEGGTEPCWQLKWSFYDDVSHGYCNEVVLG